MARRRRKNSPSSETATTASQLTEEGQTVEARAAGDVDQGTIPPAPTGIAPAESAPVAEEAVVASEAAVKRTRARRSSLGASQKRSLRSRKKKTEPVPEVQSVAPEAESSQPSSPVETPPKKRRGERTRGRRDAKRGAADSRQRAAEDKMGEWEGGRMGEEPSTLPTPPLLTPPLPDVEWRSPTTSVAEMVVEMVVPSEGERAESLAVIEVPSEQEKKKRRRHRRKRTPEAPSPEALKPQAPSPEPEPLHPAVRVVFQRGTPLIRVGEKTFKPFLFFGNAETSEGEERVFKQIIQAAKAGVHLYSLLLSLRIDDVGIQEAIENIRHWIRLVEDVNPEGYILWRVVPVASPGWQQTFPEAVYRSADGTLEQPSVCADRWWSEVERVLTRVLSTLEESDKGERILGYHLDRGEWFYSESGGYDTSEAALEAFRRWVRRRYRNDTVALRAAWHDGTVTFNNLTIPSLVPTMHVQDRHFYEPRRERRWVDYHLFLSECTAERILQLARCVREATRGRCLVGTSYGYLFEWEHPHSGHAALTKILESQEIDFLSAPPTYRDRLPGGTGAPPFPVDSITLHGKLWISEEDYITPFGQTGREEDYNPPLRTPPAVEQVHQRGLGMALTHAGGLCWMDLWGDGWLDHPEVWGRAKTFLQYWDWRLNTPLGEPDVAVLIDERSLCHVRVGSSLLHTLLRPAREAVLRSGASVGFYLLEDVLRRDFPRSRLIIFLNAWNLTPEVREAIRTRLQRDGRTLVWLYAAALYENHLPALETARDVTGIALGLQPWASSQESHILTRLHPITQPLESDRLGFSQRYEPSFYALADGITVLGEYVETGLPSLVVKEYGEWSSVFIAERQLTPGLVRGLCAYAGVHLWNQEADLTHVQPPFLLVHAYQTGDRVLLFPEPYSVFDPQTEQMLAENTDQYSLFLQEGMSALLLVAPHAELTALLRGEPIIISLSHPLTPSPPHQPLAYRKRKKKRTKGENEAPADPSPSTDAQEKLDIEWRKPGS